MTNGKSRELVKETKWVAHTDTGVRHQVGLELGQIDVEGTIETQGSGDGRHNLGDQSVQVGVGWSLNVQVSSADIVDGLVINHECTVRVLKGGVRAENRVVWLDNGSADLWGRVD